MDLEGRGGTGGHEGKRESRGKSDRSEARSWLGYVAPMDHQGKRVRVEKGATVAFRGPLAPQGAPGISGPQGLAVPQGEVGEKGESGEKGDCGVQGLSGLQGPSPHQEVCTLAGRRPRALMWLGLRLCTRGELEVVIML